MKSDVQTQIASQMFVMNANSLQELGLQESDIGEIQQIAVQIDPKNPLSVAQFGRDVAEHTSNFTDSLLDQVRNNDLDEAGAKLSQVLSMARELNAGPLSDKRSKIPFVGPYIDRFRLKTSNLMGRFDTTRDQIEKLIGEVEATRNGVATRNIGLEEMFQGSRAEHRLFGLHIAAAKLRLEEIRRNAAELRQESQKDVAKVQELADIEAVIVNLDKRIGDLLVLQHSALQSLPMIRMVQTSNQMLIDKFHTIREITIPAWKRQFSLALALNEQKNAVQLANTIDDTTNDLLRRNAELLHQNSVATAKANQRLVIDVETLRDVQNTLLKSVEEVIRAQQDGVASRQKAEKQIEAMRHDLRTRLASNGAAASTEDVAA